jgi:hypothetical protein
MAKRLMVIAQLRDHVGTVDNGINHAVFGVGAPVPVSLERVLERFGLGEARKWIGRSVLGQFMDATQRLNIVALPMELILPSLGRKRHVHAPSRLIAHRWNVRVRRTDHRPALARGHVGGNSVFECTHAQLVARRVTLTGRHLAAYVGGGKAVAA